MATLYWSRNQFQEVRSLMPPAPEHLIVCARCGRHRRVDHEKCPHCGDATIMANTDQSPEEVMVLYGPPPADLMSEEPSLRTMYGPPPASLMNRLLRQCLRFWNILKPHQ